MHQHSFSQGLSSFFWGPAFRRPHVSFHHGQRIGVFIFVAAAVLGNRQEGADGRSGFLAKPGFHVGGEGAGKPGPAQRRQPDPGLSLLVWYPLPTVPW